MTALPIKYRGKIDYAAQERVFARGRHNRAKGQALVRKLVQQYEREFLRSPFNANGSHR